MNQPVGTDASPWLGAVAAIAQARSKIVEMSRQAESAVTRPRDPGAWPSQWRLAVAARIATLNGQQALSRHYLAELTEPTLRDLADPARPGRDACEQIVLAFIDKVTAEPRAVLAEDVENLKAAGVRGADIVRLCELIAFMSYQCRVMAGIAVLQGETA